MSPRDEQGRDLQRVLHDPSLRLPDSLVDLESVHRSALSRQRRRTALAAASAVVVVAVIGVAAVRPWHDTGLEQVPDASGNVSPSIPPSPSTSAPTPTDSPSAGTVVEPVSTVTAVSADTWWLVTGSNDRCPVGDCPAVLYATTDSGHSFTVVSRSTDPKGIPAGTTQLRFLDQDRGWALRPHAAVGQQLWATDDGGHSWSLVPTTDRAVAIEAGGGGGFLLVRSGAKVGVAALSADTAAVPTGTTWLGPNTGPDPMMTVSNGDALVLWYDQDLSRGSLVSPRLPVVGIANPCSPDLGADSISATTGGISVSCASGMADQPYVSTDGAHSWSPLSRFGDQESQRFVVGSIDGGLTAVGGQDGTITLAEPTGTGAQGKPRHGEVDNAEPWTYLGFTDAQHGFGINESGRLFRSTDGGLTWTKVHVEVG